MFDCQSHWPVRVQIARLLRRIAQRLSPILTEAQIAELRDYYDNHDWVTGEPITRPVVNVINVYGDPSAMVGLPAMEGAPPHAVF